MYDKRSHTSNYFDMCLERWVQGCNHRLWHLVTVTGCILHRFGLGNSPSYQICPIIRWQDCKQGHDHHAHRCLPVRDHWECPSIFVLIWWFEGLWNLNHLLAGCLLCVHYDIWLYSELNCDQDLGHHLILRVHRPLTISRSSGFRLSESGQT